MDDRSLYINSEIMLVVDSEELTKRFTQEVIKFRKQSLKLGKDNKYISAETIRGITGFFHEKISDSSAFYFAKKEVYNFYFKLKTTSTEFCQILKKLFFRLMSSKCFTNS